MGKNKKKKRNQQRNNQQVQKVQETVAEVEENKEEVKENKEDEPRKADIKISAKVLSKEEKAEPEKCEEPAEHKSARKKDAQIRTYRKWKFGVARA